jgi:hypothetical protein
MNKILLFILLFLALPLKGYTQDTLIATEILGRPTDHSITVNAVAGFDADVFVAYGTSTGVYTNQTDTITVATGNPIEVVLDSLLANTRYYYRFCYRRNGTTDFTVRDEHSFYTQRSRGTTFRFTVESDPHLYDKKGSSTLMKVAMQNQLNDGADFVLDLGDTFGDDHNPYTITSEDVWKLHLNYRPYFGMLCHSSPLFFCLGNHEGENGFYLNETPPNNLAVYATLSRQFYYPNPVPDSFYSGNTVSEGYGIGLPENYYAWEWGDALFVVLDVYRHYTTSAKPGGWDWTIGETQYNWFKQTLENSSAKYKFVFAHHDMGQGRGGIVLADKYEWGGYNADGVTWGFDTQRPGWAMPLHQLMVANGVNIFFQGHDHLFAKEELDGLIYQEVPMPCDSTYIIGMENADAYLGDTLPPSGHLRVTVADSGVQVDYVKAVEPWDETPEHPNGEIAYSYTIGNIGSQYSLTVIQSANGVISPGTTLVDSGGSQQFKFYPSSGYHLDSAIVDGVFIPDSTEGYTFTDVTSSHTLTARFGPDTVSLPDTLLASELLGRPTNQSITLNIVPGYNMYAYVEYGTASGVYTNQTDTAYQLAGQPLEILIDNLLTNTKYYYRLCYRVSAEVNYTVRTEHSFHTQRYRGQSFVFDVQADPHLGIPYSLTRETNVDTTLYKITLQNELADNPDLLFDLGDTFMNEKYYFASYDITREAYFAHRPFFGTIGHSVPLFLVNGNHEGEVGWKLNGTSSNLALWSVRARHMYYPNPVPGEFYSGSTTDDANLILDTNIVNKKRDGYYAMEWGNALFVVLDPFWYTTSKPSSYTTDPDEGWKYTLGEAQFNWLKQTLEQTNASFKFVFIHNLIGGNSKDGRGGIEAVPYYEWGGNDITSNPEWDIMRAWEGGPIHDVLVANNVSMVLHGHDHFFCKQQLDSVIYQECPQPGIVNYTDTPSQAVTYGYVNGNLLGNSGHLRFTVTDTAVTVDYIRAYRPEDETLTRHNGDVAYTYTIKPLSKSKSLSTSTGWNLLSLPLKQQNYAKTSIYPAAMSNAFAYQNGYISKDTLENGIGYWLKFGESSELYISGIPSYLDTVDVVAGWNMVGSISDPVPITTIASDPPGIVTSNFFGYTAMGYVISDTITPGYGYWIKVNQDGKLILSSNTFTLAASRIKIQPTGELPPSPPEENIGTQQVIPSEYVLEQAYPNPFNPATTLKYQLPVDSRVTLKVYNMLGQVIAVLADEVQNAGTKSATWSAIDIASGMYFYKLEAISLSDHGKSFIQVKKMMLLK